MTNVGSVRKLAGGFCQSVGGRVEKNCWKAGGIGKKGRAYWKFILTVSESIGKSMEKSVFDLLAEHWFLPVHLEASIYIFVRKG